MKESTLHLVQKLMVYSEAGGVTKTTTAVSLAMVAAIAGKRVLLIDLDPRAAATKWLGLEPKEPGLHVGAILADENPEGWAADLAVQVPWHENLRFIPSDRQVSNREAERAEFAELRLRDSLHGLDVDLVVIDCPNRQGGPLILGALSAVDSVVYAANATADGVDGFYGAQQSVSRFVTARQKMGAHVQLQELGLIVGDAQLTVPSRVALTVIDELHDTGLLLRPIVPNRAIVREMRLTHEWYGNYRKGAPVVDAYEELASTVLA